MSALQEGVRRFKHQKQTHDWNYQWWSKADAIPALTALLAALDAGSADVRLLAVRALDADGHENLWLCTEDGETYGPGFNNSHPCPPLCV